MKGRDVLIGVAIGAFLVLFLTNYHSGKSTPHPKPSVTTSAPSSLHKVTSKRRHPAARKSHTTAASAQHTAGPKPSADAVSAKPVKPSTASRPSAHRQQGGRTTAKAAAATGKSSGLSNGLIIIACLIAFIAALSTVTMTVRGLRVAK